MSKKYLHVVISFFACTSSFGQYTLLPDTSISVFENGFKLDKAWAGGLDCPMYSAIDLNNDNVKDLFIFDHKTNRVLTFINANIPNTIRYIYAPGYASLFPSQLHDWALLYDYNNDGLPDIMTHGNGGIAVYRNNGFTPSLSFSFITNQVNTYYNFGSFFLSNIYASPLNVPTFNDMDNDGDMDILSFPLGGSYVEYHKNYAMDSLGTANAFLFYNIRVCWGYFALAATVQKAALPPGTITSGYCPAYPASSPRISGGTNSKKETESTSLHSGNILLSVDMDGDTDKDILLGDILGPSLLYVENGGDIDSAYAISQDTLFPSYNVPVRMENIAAPYILDLDNDNKEELLVANYNSDIFSGAGENYENTMLYQNVSPTAAKQFQYIKNTFMTDEMIDVGSGSHPVFFDVDADGLLDLLVASDFYYDTTSHLPAQISYYRNTGTSTNPQFNLITRDYMSLSTYNFLGLYLTFGDLDNDLDQDMVVGNNDASLTHFENTAGPGNPANFILATFNYQNISVGGNGMQSIPLLYDLNKDGLLDLVIGSRLGKLHYYRNTGSVANPVFTFVTDTLGSVDVKNNSVLGYSVPVLFQNGGVTELLVGNYDGFIYRYTNIDNNLGGSFTLSSNKYQNVFEPQNCSPALADINNDGWRDIIAGNGAGGLRAYIGTLVSVSEASIPKPGFIFYPNPVGEILLLEFEDTYAQTERTVTIYNVIGKKVIEVKTSDARVNLNVQQLMSGSYVVSVEHQQKIISKSFIKK